jgi:predicted phage terminase large subunit-like protein
MIAAFKGHGPQVGHFPGVGQGARVWWVAPTYSQIMSSDVWGIAKRVLQGSWTDKSEAQHVLTLRNGGSFAVKSADNESSLRGPGLDGLVIDEAAFCSQSIWTEVLRPALADRQGWCLMISTPNGYNWWQEMYAAADGVQVEAWKRPSRDNPLLTDTELAHIRRQIGQRAYAQEHLAEFVALEGAEWGSEVFADIWPEYWPESFEVGAIGVDPSKGRHQERGDYSAVVFVGLSGGLIWVDARIERTPVEGIVRNVIDLYDMYRPLGVGVEAAMNQDEIFGPAIQRAANERLGLPIPLYLLNNDANKVSRILRLTPWMEQRVIRLKPDNQHTQRLEEQLRAFPVPSVNDDGPDALEMAVRVLTQLVGEDHMDDTPREVYV